MLALPNNWNEVTDAFRGAGGNFAKGHYEVLAVTVKDKQNNIYSWSSPQLSTLHQPIVAQDPRAQVEDAPAIPHRFIPDKEPTDPPDPFIEIHYVHPKPQDCTETVWIGLKSWFNDFRSQVFWDLFKECAMSLWAGFFTAQNKDKDGPVVFVLTMCTVGLFGFILIAGFILLYRRQGRSVVDELEKPRVVYLVVQVFIDVVTLTFVLIQLGKVKTVVVIILASTLIIDLSTLKIPELCWAYCKGGASWDSLTPEDQQDWAILGWSKDSWDSGLDPLSESKTWLELSNSEKEAASRLGWAASWDGEPDTQALFDPCCRIERKKGFVAEGPQPSLQAPAADLEPPTTTPAVEFDPPAASDGGSNVSGKWFGSPGQWLGKMRGYSGS